MTTPLKFISVTDHTGRQSSLQVNPDTLTVVGVLPHAAKIHPTSKRDAIDLVQWLQRWIKCQ